MIFLFILFLGCEGDDVEVLRPPLCDTVQDSTQYLTFNYQGSDACLFNDLKFKVVYNYIIGSSVSSTLDIGHEVVPEMPTERFFINLSRYDDIGQSYWHNGPWEVGIWLKDFENFDSVYMDYGVWGGIQYVRNNSFTGIGEVVISPFYNADTTYNGYFSGWLDYVSSSELVGDTMVVNEMDSMFLEGEFKLYLSFE